MYNPLQLKNNFNNVEHGKARMSAIREAICEADKNNDLAYGLGFRLDLCNESCFYDDSMDMMIIFPEILAIIDKHPDLPSTYGGNAFINGLDHVLFVYKWVLGSCDIYYQIPFDDCLKFFDDFKKRCTSFGYNLKPYYKSMYDFYLIIDE